MLFIAKVIFQILIEGHQQNQFDEQLLLVEAQAESDAYLKARVMGAQQQSSFVNERNKNVSWKMIDVVEIVPVDAVEHGSVVYSRIIEEDPETFVSFVKKKALMLQTSAIAFA
jgi:hypothetical protein